MKSNGFRQWSALACAGVLALSSIQAQDKAEPKAADAKAGGAPDMSELMKQMAAMAAPGPEHKLIEGTTGEWAVTGKFWMAGPDGPTVDTKGVSTKRAILGGRFIQEEYKGDFMGMPFEGMGLMGYDRFKKKYVSMWIDSMGTALTTSEGDADSAGKLITLRGTMDDPMTNQKDKLVKYVLRVVGPDKHILEMHDPAQGEKGKFAEVTYTRK